MVIPSRFFGRRVEEVEGAQFKWYTGRMRQPQEVAAEVLVL